MPKPWLPQFTVLPDNGWFLPGFGLTLFNSKKPNVMVLAAMFNGDITAKRILTHLALAFDVQKN